MINFEAVIGLEVHAQLLTESKLFCGCSTRFGAGANAHTCPVCLGMPGVLPVLNERAVELAVRTALALGCTVHPVSQWSRKNYFYADLPKGYQISQFDRPFASLGQLTIEGEGSVKAIGIKRIHLEEDAGKNVHDDVIAGSRSYVDFNRGGIALVEIVSEPDIRTAAEASAYLKKLRQILRYLNVCDGNMEEGSFRCDANVSIRPLGQSQLGTRTELKNINSFRFVQQAIDYEILRQSETLQARGHIVQETRLWDAQAKVTRAMRGKEEAHDYRYFPDPDLPDLVLADDFVQNLRAGLPELPDAKLERYTKALGLSLYDANVLIEDAATAQLFEETISLHPHSKAVANWIINEVLREIKERSSSQVAITATQLAELLQLIDDGTISQKIAKEIFSEIMERGGSPLKLVENKGLRQVSDTTALLSMIEGVIAAHPDSVAQYKAGKTTVFGFLMGKVMQASGGKANPKLVGDLLRQKLS